MKTTDFCICTVLLSAALLAGCATSEEEDSFTSRKALLLRQNQGIRELIEAQEKGSMVPTGRFLIGIGETVVGDLFRSELPLDRPLGERLEIHLDTATILFRDKFGVVTLDGNVHRRATPDRKAAVRVIGGLSSVAVDPETKQLRLRIAIDDIEILEAGVLESVLGGGTRKFLAEKARPMLEDALPELSVPVALGQSIAVPAIEADAVSLASVQVPLDFAVERVIAAGGKLWITIDAKVGRISGADKGLNVNVKKTPRKDGSK